ncbi:MAG: hypothetical protein SGARI_004236 [Bacillariaceae sp.]
MDTKDIKGDDGDAVVDMETTEQQESPSTLKRRSCKSESLSASRVSQSPASSTKDAAGEDGKQQQPESSGEKGSPKKKKAKTSKQQDKEDMSWICAECKEADCGLVTKLQGATTDPHESAGDAFLICEGSCHRIFHVPCAGLSKVPDSDDPWLSCVCVLQ